MLQNMEKKSEKEKFSQFCKEQNQKDRKDNFVLIHPFYFTPKICFSIYFSVKSNSNLNFIQKPIASPVISYPKSQNTQIETNHSIISSHPIPSTKTNPKPQHTISSLNQKKKKKPKSWPMIGLQEASFAKWRKRPIGNARQWQCRRPNRNVRKMLDCTMGALKSVIQGVISTFCWSW